MINYRDRPKEDYIKDARWQDLYLLAENWKSNLEFQVFEIKFLERLVESYFVKLLLRENLDELRELQKDLYHSKNDAKILLQRVQSHLEHIVDILDKPFKYDTLNFRNKYEQLEDDFSEFITMQKVIRYTVFKMTNDVLKSENPKFIWKYN